MSWPQYSGDVDRWREDALCAEIGDIELFFPGNGGSAAPAKRVCARRPVIAACRAYAVAHHVRHGVWGGLSERELRRLMHREEAA
jgi:WhiB family redox-sensing transcriptional regulator